MTYPTETQEQEALFKIAQTNPITRDYLYANVQEGKIHCYQGYNYKRRGKKPGIPDVCMPYPSGEYHGLYIELKRSNKLNHATPAQAEWIHRLRAAGNYANVAYGWEDAWRQITSYLQNKAIPYDLTINKTIDKT